MNVVMITSGTVMQENKQCIHSGTEKNRKTMEKAEEERSYVETVRVSHEF